MPGTITTFSRVHGIVNLGKDNPVFAGTVTVTPSGLNITFSPSLPPGTNYHVNISKVETASKEDAGLTTTKFPVPHNGFSMSVIETATVEYEVNIY